MYYVAVLTLISIQIWLCLRQCINIFRKLNDFHKTQTHHVILYPECNLPFSFFPLPLIFSYLNNVKWIEYVLMTIFHFSCGFYRKRINISVTLVSECYVLLYYEKKSLYVIYHSNMTSFKRFESKPVIKIIYTYTHCNLWRHRQFITIFYQFLHIRIEINLK